jgi:uncharacterized Rmd1/YagE family protein
MYGVARIEVSQTLKLPRTQQLQKRNKKRHTQHRTKARSQRLQDMLLITNRSFLTFPPASEVRIREKNKRRKARNTIDTCCCYCLGAVYMHSSVLRRLLPSSMLKLQIKIHLYYTVFMGNSLTLANIALYNIIGAFSYIDITLGVGSCTHRI